VAEQHGQRLTPDMRLEATRIAAGAVERPRGCRPQPAAAEGAQSGQERCGTLGTLPTHREGMRRQGRSRRCRCRSNQHGVVAFGGAIGVSASSGQGRDRLVGDDLGDPAFPMAGGLAGATSDLLLSQPCGRSTRPALGLSPLALHPDGGRGVRSRIGGAALSGRGRGRPVLEDLGDLALPHGQRPGRGLCPIAPAAPSGSATNWPWPGWSRPAGLSPLGAAMYRRR
jgi:hypothetical protein